MSERAVAQDLAIRCLNLFKTYRGKPPVEAVRGVDLEVRTGECFGVLGPNGAGKTTTIEILEGLLEADSGTVEVLGQSWDADATAIRQRIGVSLQETQLSDRLSVRETLSLFRSFYNAGMSVEESMEVVSLTGKADSWVKNLSGGQKQRLAVATALVGDPDLLFLDEPTTGLDPASRRELWEIIRQVRREGKTVLLTTHYMEEAERLCDRVAIFDEGKVIALGTPSELIQSLGASHVIEFAVESDAASDEHPMAEDWLRSLPSVESCDRSDNRYRLAALRPHDVLPPLLRGLTERGLRMSSLATRNASLEDVFVSLTGKALTDSE